MAARDLIARGVGFAPGSTKFIPTHGFTPAVPPERYERSGGLSGLHQAAAGSSGLRDRASSKTGLGDRAGSASGLREASPSQTSGQVEAR